MSYYKVARTADVPGGNGLAVRLGRDEIGVFRLGAEYLAISNLCPHRGAPLSEGYLEQERVFCPWHCFDFHLRTGESTIAPHLCVTTYPVKVDGDEIFILYPDELIDWQNDWPAGGQKEIEDDVADDL